MLLFNAILRHIVFTQLTYTVEIIFCITQMWLFYELQWNLCIKDTVNKGHLSNEDTVYLPNLIQLCTNLPLN